MITLKQIADLFLHDFSGGVPSKDSTLDRRDVIKKARGFLNTVLKPVVYEKLSEGDRSAITQAIYTYELSLQEDSTGQKYLAIPDSYMALVHNRGIHRIFSKGNPYNDYVIQHHPGITGNLPHTKIKGVQFAYIEGMKVMMSKGCTAKKSDKIILQIINTAPDAIGENDALPMAPEHLSEVLRLLKQDYFPTVAIPADMTNNQNPNK